MQINSDSRYNFVGKILITASEMFASVNDIRGIKQNPISKSGAIGLSVGKIYFLEHSDRLFGHL